MASLLQKLLKKPSYPPLRILASLTKPDPRSLQNPSIDHIPPKSLHPNGGEAFPPPLRPPLPIFPSFPHSIHWETISQPVFDPPCTDSTGGGAGGDGMIWADSVKKKRKRKMNKHKYRKLRKLLRRKT